MRDEVMFTLILPQVRPSRIGRGRCVCFVLFLFLPRPAWVWCKKATRPSLRLTAAEELNPLVVFVLRGFDALFSLVMEQNGVLLDENNKEMPGSMSREYTVETAKDGAVLEAQWELHFTSVDAFFGGYFELM